MLEFDVFYWHLKKYKKRFGHLNIPTRYKDPMTGYSLGKIASNVRGDRVVIYGDEERALNRIGFVWKLEGVHNKIAFDVLYEALKEYKDTHEGSMAVPTRYVTKNGLKLGSCVQRIRAGKYKLSSEERVKIDEIGFIWKIK